MNRRPQQPSWPAGHVPLERALSKLGLLSRTEARAAIVAGRVVVDGRELRDPQHLVVPERIRVVLDGQQAGGAPLVEPLLIALHKPKGVLTTQRDPRGRPTVFELLTDVTERVVAVGRLDAATTGLLLLTNDTRLADRLTDPRSLIERVYLAEVEGLVDESKAQLLQEGVLDAGERLAATRVVVRKASGRESQLLLSLTEGKNREVRRLCAAVGHPVRRLKRIQYGPVVLGALQPGQWQRLDAGPIYALCRLESPAVRASGRQRRPG